MLPLIRMTVLGCVLIATLGLAAGFADQPGPRTYYARVQAPARGPLIEQAQHPEWKAFVVLAAVRRAEELERLRDLTDPRPPGDWTGFGINDIAGLPATRDDAEPEDTTGSIIDKTTNDVIPIDIGETSSTELPIRAPDSTPVIDKAPRLKLPDQNSHKPVRKLQRRVRAKPAPATTADSDPLAQLFGAVAATPTKPKPAARKRTAKQ